MSTRSCHAFKRRTHERQLTSSPKRTRPINSMDASPARSTPKSRPRHRPTGRLQPTGLRLEPSTARALEQRASFMHQQQLKAARRERGPPGAGSDGETRAKPGPRPGYFIRAWVPYKYTTRPRFFTQRLNRHTQLPGQSFTGGLGSKAPAWRFLLGGRLLVARLGEREKK